jgi:signal transduction histidine kinase
MKWWEMFARSLSETIRLTLSGILILLPTLTFADTLSTRFFSKVAGIEISAPLILIDSGGKCNFLNYKSASPVSVLDSLKENGEINEVIWISFSLSNTSDTKRKIVLESPLSDSLLFLLKYPAGDSLKIAGRNINNSDHQLNTQRRTTEVYIGRKEVVHVILKMVPTLKPIAYDDLFVLVTTEEDFLKESVYAYFKIRKTITIAVIFLSMLLFQLLFIGVQGLYTRRIEYLYYLLYAFSIGMYYLSKYELALNWDIFFTFFPSTNFVRSNILLYIPYFFYYRFARHYCEIEKHEPKLARKIKVAEKGVLMICILLFICIYLNASFAIFQFILFFGLISLLIASVYFIFKVYLLRNILSRILVAGSVLALFTSLVANFATYSKWLYDSLPVTPLELTMIGVIAEMIVFNAGLVIKARLLEREQRIFQEKLHQEAEEKRRLILQNIEERDRIAADLHDDIGATLSSISIYSDSAAQKLRLGDHQRAAKLLEQIGTNARTTMNTMSDIVWAINPVNDDNRHLIAKMESFASTLLQSKGIEFDFNITKVNPSGELPPGARKSIFMIFKEAINNSAKYSGATRVSVELEEDERAWMMNINDNGCGFNPDEVKSGNGLRNIRNRAKESRGIIFIHSDSSGTVVSLKIPK